MGKCFVGLVLAAWAGAASGVPLDAGVFDQPVHRGYTVAEGLPDNDVRWVGWDAVGGLAAETAGGWALFDGTRWQAASAPDWAVARRDAQGAAGLSRRQLARLEAAAGGPVAVRGVARQGAEIAVAADRGLFVGDGRGWSLALPREGATGWAPVDVRVVAYDAAGRLWFGAPQGVGCRVEAETWRLYTGAEGLPYNDFTCVAAGPKGLWFGTTRGAIHHEAGAWSYRQGRRWLLDDAVRAVAVDGAGSAWLATAGGVSRIDFKPMTLAEKAAFYEAEIERYHRRTEFGFVAPARLASPGDKSTAEAVFTDNDGHYTGLYLAAVSLGYAVTGREKLREDAARAFRALAFLGTVTEGGSHPAPKGFIARSVLPTSAPDPNPQFDLAYDQRRNAADAMWKIIQPRWPIDATGQWYWKNDSSSDELDGHFFGFAVYFDRVCRTEAEKAPVRGAVRRIIDHILAHGYNLVDHDGTPTRWARFSPDDLNRNAAWCDERGLNSYSILTYLSIAHHITGDPKYRAVLRTLAWDHGYGMNGMTQPKCISGPGFTGHQPDDNMAFMNYYHLLRYETDPELLGMFQHAIYRHWQHEKVERNAFANLVYAACCMGQVRRDHWGATDIAPPPHCFEDSVDTLKRFPLDLVDWPMSNAHRIDLRVLVDERGEATGSGGRLDGQVFPVDERHEVYWDLNPWALSYAGEGLRLREGVPFLLAYYLGRAHGFLE